MGSEIVHAQTVPVPNQVNPGLIQRQETDRRERWQPATQPQAPAEIQNRLPEAPDKKEETEKLHTSGFQVDAKAVQVKGVTLYPEAAIRKITRPYEGRVLSMDDLKKLVYQLNQLYYKDGYYTTQAFVPPQDFSTGVVQVHVLEGMIEEVTVTQNKYYKAAAIKRDFAVEPGQALNIVQLTETLNRLNQQHQSQYRLKAELKAGEKPGLTEVVLDVQEKQPFQVTPTFDNMGRPYIGLMRYGLDLVDQSLSGNGDRFTASVSGSAGTRSVNTSYNTPVGKHGTDITYAYSRSFVDIDLGIPDQPKYQGNSQLHAVTVRQALGRKKEYFLDLALNDKDSDTKYDDTLILQEKVRSIAVGFSMNKIDRHGGTFLRAQTDFAPAWFGSNRQFWKTSGYLSRWQRLAGNQMLILRGSYQLTPDGLPGLESYQIGGAYSVHGYTEGLLSGDRGYNFGIEHRWPIPYLDKISPWAANRIQGATSVDIGQVWLDKGNVNYVRGVSSSPERTLLAGVGLGLRLYLTRFMTGFVDMGYGLTHQDDIEPYAQPDVRLHFGLRANLLPETFEKKNPGTKNQKKLSSK